MVPVQVRKAFGLVRIPRKTKGSDIVTWADIILSRFDKIDFYANQIFLN